MSSPENSLPHQGAEAETWARIPSDLDALRTQCWNGAFHAYATSYIFQRRARILKKRVQWITYIGFAVPMVVGLIVLAYSHLKSLPIVIAVAAALGIGQAAISLWAIVGGWVDGATYAATSAAANDHFAARYTDLAENPPANMGVFQEQYHVLRAEDRARTEQDFQQGVKEAEKHMGMRASLRKYQRECAACGVIPVSMKATDCGVCGEFRYRIR